MSDFLDDFEADEIKAGTELGGDRRDHSIKFQMLDDFHIVIFPREVKMLPSQNEGGEPYEAVVSDILIVDGPIKRSLREAGLTETPFMAKGINISSWQVRENIKPKLGTLKGIPALVNSQPSKKSSGNAMGIESGAGMAKLPAAVLDKASKIKAEYLAERTSDEFTA